MSDKFTLAESHGQLHGEINTSIVTVSDTPTRLPPNALSGRKDITLHNSGSNPVFVGGPSVTVGDGRPLAAGAELRFEAGRVPVYAVAASGTNEAVRVFEIS